MAKISVVMAVYNGEQHLGATLESLWNQTERDFELIVVDDGSTDGSQGILAAQRDPRLRVIRQPNAGLTIGLIRGCAEASANVIARHDCGDLSAPDRLARQLETLQESGSTVLVSCSTEFHAPEGETLYISAADGWEIQASLLRDSLDNIRSLPHHGSAMFRAEAYKQVGGYRREFYFAQDLDLWIRLASIGNVKVLGSTLYHARMDLNAISAVNRPEQVRTARVIVQLRDHPESTASLLWAASNIRPVTRRATRTSRARALYFIASCLRRRGDPAWRRYASAALHSDPLALRTWALLARRS